LDDFDGPDAQLGAGEEPDLNGGPAEHDDVPAGEAVAEDDVRPQLPKRPTANFYCRVAGLPLHPQTEITVKQACFAALRVKIDYNVHDAAFDCLMKFAAAILPPGHFLPGSWHLMKAVVGVESAEEYCHHLCPNPLCCYVFPDLDRSEWSAHHDECCKNCGCARFKTVAGRLAPRRRCEILSNWLPD